MLSVPVADPAGQLRWIKVPLKSSSGAVDAFYMNILYVIIAVLVIIVLLRVLGVV